MENPNYYAILSADVRYDKELNFGTRLLYAEITALANKTGKCWANNSYFSDLYDVDERTIIRWLKQLNDKRYIDIEIKNKFDRVITIPTTKMSIVGRPLDVQIGRSIGTTKMSGGYDKNVVGGYDKNVDNNNTSINNKYNNICVPKETPQLDEPVNGELEYVDEYQKEGQKEHGEKKEATDDFMSYFQEKYKKNIHKDGYVFSPRSPKLRKQVQSSALKFGGFERLKELVDLYFDRTDKFTLSRAYSLEFFLSNSTLNELDKL